VWPNICRHQLDRAPPIDPMKKLVAECASNATVVGAKP
jgi:hypothetical protein